MYKLDRHKLCDNGLTKIDLKLGESEFGEMGADAKLILA